MKITEARLRQIIQEILLEGRADFEQGTQDIKYFSDFDDPLFANPESKKNIEPARNVKKAWSMAVDKIEADEYEEGKEPPRISRARQWIQSLHKVTWMSYDGDILTHLYKFLNDTDRRGEISCALTIPGQEMERTGGWSWLGVEVDGWVTLAAEDMNAMMTGYFRDVPHWQHRRFASSGTPRKPTRYNIELGKKYIIGPEDASKINEPDGSTEALVANWTPKRIIIDVKAAADDLRFEERSAGGGVIGPFIYALQHKIKLPIADTMGNPVDLRKLEDDARARYY
jgi:hypothetical protein